MRFVLTLLLFVGAVFFAQPASAFCFEPSAPQIFLISKPQKPFCLQLFSDTPCNAWEIDSYRMEVKRFVARLQLYVNEAVAFGGEATDYAKCMIKSLDD